MRSLKKSQYPFLFLVPALLVYAVFFIIPTSWGFLFAFTDWNSNSIWSFKIIWFDNFKMIFSDPDLMLALKNTLLFAVVTVILKNLVGMLLAKLANRRSFASKYYVRGVFYIPNILNMTIIGVMFTALLHPSTGMLNEFLNAVGLSRFENDWLNNVKISMLSICGVEVWRTAGFNMIIFLAAFKSIPQEYYEAAKMDGAGSIRRFFHVELPLIVPSINVSVVLSIITGLKVFDQVYILTNGGPGNATQVVNTQVYRMLATGNWGLGTAYNLVLTLIVIAISLSTLKWLRNKEVEH